MRFNRLASNTSWAGLVNRRQHPGLGVLEQCNLQRAQLSRTGISTASKSSIDSYSHLLSVLAYCIKLMDEP